MKRYACPEDNCGWIGTRDEMRADYIQGHGDCDEVHSNFICPKCGYWHDYLSLCRGPNHRHKSALPSTLEPLLL